MLPHLTAGEETLIDVVKDWARQLAMLGVDRNVERSDSWFDEDLADATAAAVEGFESQESEKL